MPVTRCLLALPVLLPAQAGSAPPTLDVRANNEIRAALERLSEFALPPTLDATRESLDDAWEVRTPHYVVRHCGSPQLASWCGSVVEAARSDIEELFGGPIATDGRFEVRIYPNLEAYNQLGEEYDGRSSVWGAFHAATTAGSPVAALFEPNYFQQAFYLRYGVTLQLLERAFPNAALPLALRQGLAAYVASRYDPAYWLDRFEDVRDNRQWIPLGQLVFATIDTYPDRGFDRLVLLAHAVRYLVEHRNLEGGGVRALLSALREGGTLPIDDPVLRTLTEDTATLDAELRGFRGWRR